MQITGVTDMQGANPVLASRNQQKDFSADLQQAIDAQGVNQTLASSLSMEALHYLSPSAPILDTQIVDSQSLAEAKREEQAAQKAQSRVAEENIPVEEHSTTEDAEKLAEEGAIDPDAGQEHESPAQDDEDTSEEEIFVSAVDDQDEHIAEESVTESAQAVVEETPVVDTASTTQNTSAVTEIVAEDEVIEEDEEAEDADAIDALNMPLIDYTAYTANTAQASNFSYDEIKQMLLMFCMMMMMGSSDAGDMQGLLMVVLAQYMGNMLDLQDDVSNTALASGIDQSAVDAMNRSLFADTENYPTRQSRPCNPLITSDMTNRNPTLYAQVIKQFDVENSARYAPGSKTWCNIFLWDVTSAMGAEIPHYVDRDTRAPATYPNTSNASELNANATYKWLKEVGPQYGWTEVSAEVAQQYANNGRPAVTSWKNPSGASGHVQIVAPSKDGQYNADKGVAIAQAGRKVIEQGYISDIYGPNLLKSISYFVHA